MTCANKIFIVNPFEFTQSPQQTNRLGDSDDVAID